MILYENWIEEFDGSLLYIERWLVVELGFQFERGHNEKKIYKLK